ncbi:hypothetical protein, partial [Enterobacter cloacae complex sp. SHL007]
TAHSDIVEAGRRWRVGLTRERARLRIQPMLDFRRVLKNREIQPEAAFCPTKNQGLEWMNSNPRMQIAQFFKNIMIFITHFVFFSFRFRANSLVFIDNT